MELSSWKKSLQGREELFFQWYQPVSVSINHLSVFSRILTDQGLIIMEIRYETLLFSVLKKMSVSVHFGHYFFHSFRAVFFVGSISFPGAFCYACHIAWAKILALKIKAEMQVQVILFEPLIPSYERIALHFFSSRHRVPATKIEVKKILKYQRWTIRKIYSLFTLKHPLIIVVAIDRWFQVIDGCPLLHSSSF